MFRKPSLIAGTTKKMALTYVGSAVCAATVVIIDSLVAGISIGEEALAAIAAAGPLLAITQVLHCLLGFGIDKLMVQAIGEGRREEADRIFGAILIAVVAVFLIVFYPLLAFERLLLQSFMTDAALVDMVVDYTIPLFATAAIFESFLCIERAFRIDGRAKLFSQRSIVTNIANILFDVLLVSVLGLGVSGLAWSSIISTTLGYTITLSHFFSDKRTVSPDFSVVRSMEEFVGYIKRDIRMGSSATLDELMSIVALSVQTVAVGVIGGADGLAIWAVFKSLRGVVLSGSNGVSASVSVHAGLLFGQGDYDGVRYSIKEGVILAQIISFVATMIVILFAEPIVAAYHLPPELQPLGATCLRICVAFPAISFITVVTAYLPSVDKVGLTTRFVLLQHGLTMVPAVFGYSMGLEGFFASYAGAQWFALLIFVFLLVRDRCWFVPEHNPLMIAEYSVELDSEQISSVSVDVSESLASAAYPMPLCNKVGLAIEESLNFIAQHNSGVAITADVVLKRSESGILFAVLDDGSLYCPLVKPTEDMRDKVDWGEPGMLETALIFELASDVRYDRVLDLNYLSLLIAEQG